MGVQKRHWKFGFYHMNVDYVERIQAACLSITADLFIRDLDEDKKLNQYTANNKIWGATMFHQLIQSLDLILLVLLMTQEIQLWVHSQ